MQPSGMAWFFNVPPLAQDASKATRMAEDVAPAMGSALEKAFRPNARNRP
jgi:hypothetical protein